MESVELVAVGCAAAADLSPTGFSPTLGKRKESTLEASMQAISSLNNHKLQATNYSLLLQAWTKLVAVDQHTLVSILSKLPSYHLY